MPSFRLLRHVVVVACAALFAPGFARADQEITTCGTFVTGRAFLAADLDCTGEPGPILSGQGIMRIDLRGHTLTSDCVVAIQAFGTSDVRVFSSEGTGRLQGPGGCGVEGVLNLYDRVTLRDVVIDGYGVGVRSGSMTATRSTISNNTHEGVFANSLVTLKDAIIENNSGSGVRGLGDSRLNMRRGAIRGNGGDGASTTRAYISDAEVVNNAGHGATVSGSATRDAFLRLVNAAVHGNGLSGFRQDGGRGAVLQDSNVTGNAIDAGCTPSTCADVVSDVSPQLKGSSTCETSLNPDTGTSLGVCSLD